MLAEAVGFLKFTAQRSWPRRRQPAWVRGHLQWVAASGLGVPPTRPLLLVPRGKGSPLLGCPPAPLSAAPRAGDAERGGREVSCVIEADAERFRRACSRSKRWRCGRWREPGGALPGSGGGGKRCLCPADHRLWPRRSQLDFRLQTEHFWKLSFPPGRQDRTGGTGQGTPSPNFS